MKSSDYLEAIAEAFSRKASIYDEFGEDHVNLERMRRKVREHMIAFLEPGDRILELNAGTGGDAVFFARQGFRVHAIDISPGMLARIEEKIAQETLQERLTTQLCSFTELQMVNTRPFQYVFSNMGGVNCEKDLTCITRGIEGLLSPGGYVTWVAMPPFCPWELGQALVGNFNLAARRLHPNGVLANVEGVRFKSYYFTPSQVRRAFGMNYQIVKLQGLAVFTPPADNKGFAFKYPRFNAILQAVDDRLAEWYPFNHWGDFFVITLRYLPVRHLPG